MLSTSSEFSDPPEILSSFENVVECRHIITQVICQRNFFNNIQFHVTLFICSHGCPEPVSVSYSPISLKKGGCYGIL